MISYGTVNMIWGTCLVLWALIDNVLQADPSDNWFFASITFGCGIFMVGIGEFNFKLQKRNERRRREHEETMSRLEKEHNEIMDRIRRDHDEVLERIRKQHIERFGAEDWENVRKRNRFGDAVP